MHYVLKAGAVGAAGAEIRRLIASSVGSITIECDDRNDALDVFDLLNDSVAFAQKSAESMVARPRPAAGWLRLVRLFPSAGTRDLVLATVADMRAECEEARSNEVEYRLALWRGWTALAILAGALVLRWAKWPLLLLGLAVAAHLVRAR